jgi:hypothetical protein
MSDTYNGSCFCGAVTFTVKGEPAAQGYCHCGDCRTWSASPLNGFSLWKPDAVTITRGEDQVGVFHKTDRSYRKFCKTCGGHLMNEHPHWQLVDVYAAMIPEFAFKPQVHVHYQETVLPMHDGLPKLQDLPAEMGGSGKAIPE